MSLTEIESNSTDTLSRSFWTGKHTATTIILGILALIVAYLQYFLYPALMTGPEFGLKNVTINFSFLTFQYSVTRCEYSSCVRQVGVPAFDIFQAIILITVVMNMVHLYYVSKKN